MPDKRTAAGIALLAVAVAVVEERRFFPARVVQSFVIVFVVLIWAGLTLIVRGQRRSWKSESRVRPLQPGEVYDRPVRLAVVPNMPIAEVWRQRLQEEGIDAVVGVTLLRSPSGPVALLVGEHDLDRARELFPELQQSGVSPIAPG